VNDVVAIMSMSLDGYVAGPDDDVSQVFDWYFTSGDVELRTGGSSPMTFTVSEASAEHVRTTRQCLGAGLLDYLQFDVAAVLLGSGVRLFDHLAGTPTVLGSPTAVSGVGVTHLRYPVRKG
jgi:hypothetical protein